MVTTNKRVEELRDYFKSHSKFREQKAHTAKVLLSILIQLT